MLTRVSVGFNNPIGIDHHEPSNQVVLSVHYSSGRPYNFELVAPDGARTKFSEISGLTEEVKISCVRSGPNQGGFLVGELFTGTGTAGVIARISPDGGTIRNPWVRLPGERGLMRGSLFQDRYGVFGGDLIAVTTTGGVWRVNADGVAARLAQINTHLEGVTTVPDNPAKYGPWAGKILIGAENQDRIYTVSATGSVSYYAIGVAPEDIEIIPENENFYGVDYGGRTLWGAPASAFAGMVGDVLIAQESPGILWHVWWDPASGKFQKKSLAQVRQWEHVAFSPAGLLTIPPVPETRDPCPPAPPQPGPAATSLAYLGPRAVLCERPLRVSAQLTDAAGRPLSGRTLTFSAAGLSAAAATDAGGIARTVLEVGHVASPLPLLVSFAGAPDLLPSSVQADVEIQPADSALTYTGRPLLALGVAQEVSARLTDALDGRPLQGRAVAFQVGSQTAQATTDANGLATTAVTIPTGERPTEVVISFAGDLCYRPSSARAPIIAYLPTSFVIWGGNPTQPAIGQRVNFWGAQWSKQVAGGDYDAHADFKGYASLVGDLQICQPSARTTGSPRLDPSCWTSKPGQSGPPAPPLPDHIGVIVATSIAKDQSTIYGNVAAVVVVRVDPNPAYGAVPGKPGFGTIVGAVEDGAGLFPQPPALLATQAQPVTALPGEAFDVTTEIANPSSATAGVAVEQRFDGVTPAAATIDAGSIDAGARKSVATRVSATTLGVRSEGESSAAYATRLESADGRDLRSASTIAFRDAAGQSYPPILVASSSRLRLPRLAATLSGTTCLGPGSEVAYELGAINAGSADAASATGRLRFPDGTSAETALGALAVGGAVKAPFQWKVPAMPPKGAAEPPEEYEARLAAQDAQPLTAIAELLWKDTLGNEYGAVEQPFANTLRVPIVTTAPKNPAPLLPGAKTALVYTTQNRGSGNAFSVQIRVTSPGGSVAASAPFSLRGSSEPTPVQVAASAPAVAAKKAGEKDADYLARLQSANGVPLEFRHALTWQDASAAVYGPVEGSVTGTQVLPVLSLSLQGPETAMSGDAIGYTATVTNLGHADAGSVIVHFTLPDGSKRDVQLPTLAAGATGRAPAAYTIPGSQATGTIVGKASLTWRDAVPNAYGPLEAAASTHVTHRNQAPEVSAGANQTIVLPAGASLKGTVKDDAYPVGAPLTIVWSKVNGPGQVTFADPGKPVTTASFSAPGTYALRLTASDGELTGRDEVTVVVKPALQVNQPPVVKAGADKTVMLPEALVLEGQVTDDGLPTGGALTSVWTQVSGPALAVFADPHSPTTTVTFDQPGAYVLRLSASDSALVASDEVAFTVNPAVPLNQPPEVEAGPDETTSVAATIELQGDVTDDGRPVGADLIVQWSVVSGPGAAVFGSPNHALTTVTFAEEGTYVLRLTASDSQFTASDDVTLTVTPAMQINQPPVVDAGAAQTIQLPAGVDLAGTVIDDGLPQGGVLALAWSAVSGPGEVTFVDPEAATTTARFSLPGTYVLRLTADDLEYRTSDDVTITVEPAPVLNDAPVVDAGPNQTLTLPAAATLNGSVTDDGFPEGGVLTSQWNVVSGPGLVTFADRTQATTTATFVDPGTYVLRLSASDSQLTGSDDITVTASAPAGAKPTVSLTNPADGAEVTTFTDVTGSVSGGIWKLDYRLDGDAASTAPWTVFASGSGAVSNAKLGVFDPTMLLNGTYAIRLTVTTAGGSASTTKNVVVKGNLKIGNFTLTFTDLDIPMAGVPIQLLRTYDSRDKRKGDFGIGWTLSIRDVRLEKSAVLGQHWEQTRSAGVLPTFCLRPTRPLIVTITFSTGKVYKFEAITTPQCQQVAPLTEATLGFRPVAGTRGSLAALDDSAALVEMTSGGAPGPCELTSYRTFTAINPRLFRLTTEDGIEYVIHQRDGLQSIKDLNGNTITINANGLIHSLGKSVAFVRDGQGRITKITDPAGNAMTYTYDANGDLRAFTDREGNATTFTYDETHRLLTILDPLGRQAVRNEYDEHGRLVSHTDASGNTIRYAHDLAARHEIVTNRLGQQTLYEYDGSGNVVRVTASDGAVTQSTYDAQNNKLTETDALGNTTRYTYDAAGNPTSVTDPLGNVQRFTRNSRGQLLSLTDALGRTATTAYDGRGNLTSVTDPAGAAMTISYPTRGATPIAVQNASAQVTRIEYDAIGNPIKVIDALNNVRIYTYDANNRRLSETLTRTAGTGTETLVTRLVYDRMSRVVEMIRPDGTVERTAYDPAGRVILKTDVLGRAIRSEYDELGRLVRTTFPDETWESTSYDAEGNRTSSTDRTGRVTRYEYGANGKLAKVIAPDGTATTSEYDLAGRLIKSVDPDGNATLHEYDAAGRNTKVTDALGNVTLFSYDASGNLVARTDANGNTTRYEYDGNNRRTRTVYADGTSEVTAYDPMGNLREQIDQLGHVTKFEHDALNRLAGVVDALGGVTSYAYDEAGNRVTQTDAAGRTTRFEYDRARYLVRRTLPSGLSERFEYDAAGRRTAKIDFNGARTEYRYDAVGRLIEKRPDPRFGVAPIVFSYRPDGSRASMVDASGTTAYEYDARGRLTAKHTPQGILRYTYDGRGNLASLSSDASDGVSVRYAYDRLSRLVEVVDERLTAGTTRYTYDATGNLASMAQPSGVQTSWAYDALHRLVEVAVTGGVPLARYAYALAATGHRTAVTELGGRTVTYGHDALSRLIDEAISGAGSAEANGSIRYAYDAVSNRLSRVSTIAAVPGATYAYDPNDRLTSNTYDANGNTLRSEDRRFEYDFEDHLQKLVDGNQTFVYDGDGNCVAKTVEGITTRYLVDTLNPTGLPQVMEERVDGAVRRVYTYGLDLLCQRQIVDGAFRTSFYLLDGQGSVRALTDENGSITDTYDYDAFGNLLASTGSTANERRYRGEWFDARMGLYSLRARYYDPATGRFTTSDPFLGDPFAPVSLHRYLYANANPIAFHDPTGLFSMPSMMISTAIMGTLQTLAAGMLKGALLGVATNVVVTLIENYLSGRNLLRGLAHSAWSGAIFGALAGTGVLALPYVRAVAIGLGFGMAMVGAVEAFLVEQNYSLGAFRMVLILLPFMIAFRARPRRSGGDDLVTIYIPEEGGTVTRLQMLDDGSVKIVGEGSIWFYVEEQAAIARLRSQVSGGGWLQAVQVLKSFVDDVKARAKPLGQARFPEPTYVNRRGSTEIEQYGVTGSWLEAFENAIRELDDRFIPE